MTNATATLSPKKGGPGHFHTGPGLTAARIAVVGLKDTACATDVLADPQLYWAHLDTKITPKRR
jgi:hypothetical protein